MTVFMPARVYNRRNREIEKASFSSGRRHRGRPMSGASTNPGIYPGNPSLPKEVREKILSTFKHTLNLYQEGKLDDCVIGCDFILKMDPRFSPARRLLEKAKNPAADIDLIELEAIVATTPVAPAAGLGGRRETPRAGRRELQRAGLRRLHQRRGAGPDRACPATSTPRT